MFYYIIEYCNSLIKEHEIKEHEIFPALFLLTVHPQICPILQAILWETHLPDPLSLNRQLHPPGIPRISSLRGLLLRMQKNWEGFIGKF